jgi:hypothetical protein
MPEPNSGQQQKKPNSLKAGPIGMPQRFRRSQKIKIE